MKQLNCVYESNINGFRIDNDEFQWDDKRVQAVENAVVDFANEFCDDDGVFEGDMEAVKRITVEAVSQHFGSDFEVIFEEDDLTT